MLTCPKRKIQQASTFQKVLGLPEKVIRESRRIVEEGVDFLEAAVGFDCRLALRIGTDKLLEDGARHGGLLKLEMRISNFEERGWDFIAG